MNFIENETKEKLRGGYYTPEPIARFLARWVMSSASQSVLEPSCGDGQFLAALDAEVRQGRPLVTAIELMPDEAAKAQRRARTVRGIRPRVLTEDFLAWSLKRLAKKDEAFDAVVGNPPFIRYQYLPQEYQAKAEEIFKAFHLPFTKHTNAWVPFVVASVGLLRPGGRLAMVLPAELIHVMHAQSLRSFLGHSCKRLLIVDPEEIWFEKTLQGAIVLLAEKKTTPQEKSHGLAIRRVSGLSFVTTDPRDMFETSTFVNGKTIDGKWTRALMNEPARNLLNAVASNKNVFAFDAVATVDVGLVTGSNKFFLVPNSVVEKHGLAQWAHPMFGRSEHCPGLIYDDAQHAANERQDLPTNFLWLNEAPNKLPPAVKSYVALGESLALHRRFKCRVRNPWYVVPSVYATEVGMLKRCHDAPRLIHNTMGAYTTDTAYRIRSLACPPPKLVYCFINSLTALTAELEGRHYGGGVLELVPSEIERLLIPLPTKLRPALRRLDGMVRDEPMPDVLAAQDRAVLAEIGLDRTEQARIYEAWFALRNRRHRVTYDSGASNDFKAEERGIALSSVDSRSGAEQVAPSH